MLEEGQPMRGLGYFKNKDPPVALADNEYPPWLWSLLDFGSKGSTDVSNALDGNVFCEQRKVFVGDLVMVANYLQRNPKHNEEKLLKQ